MFICSPLPHNICLRPQYYVCVHVSLSLSPPTPPPNIICSHPSPSLIVYVRVPLPSPIQINKCVRACLPPQKYVARPVKVEVEEESSSEEGGEATSGPTQDLVGLGGGRVR